MSILSSTNTGKNFFSPRTKEELKKIIEFEIDKNGHTCSLNHIDVSKITDMSFLFFKSKFNGDISEWDVSNVRDMSCMFKYSEYTGRNGDISKWNIRNVNDMYGMFEYSLFDSDLSKWRISKKCLVVSMFYESACRMKYKPFKLL
jgi:surface protein